MVSCAAGSRFRARSVADRRRDGQAADGWKVLPGRSYPAPRTGAEPGPALAAQDAGTSTRKGSAGAPAAWPAPARGERGTRLAPKRARCPVTAPGDSSTSCLTTRDLLATLTPGTDLGRVVERVCRARLSHVVVSAAAEAAWAAKDPAGWARVREWLAAQRAQIVRISPGGSEHDASG